MAERIVSPGVFTRENDLSFLAQGVGQIGAAFIGPLKEGPAFVPTIVTTQSEFEDKFGKVDGTYYTEYAVQTYLREAGQATIVRVAGIGGYTQVAPLGIFSNSKLVGVLYSTSNGYQNYGFQGTTVAGISGSLVINNISGSGTTTDIGQHTFDNSLNHTHTISTANSFLYNPTDTSNTLNVNAGSSFAYVPPQAQLAFIMYNNLIT